MAPYRGGHGKMGGRGGSMAIGENGNGYTVGEIKINGHETLRATSHKE